MGDRYIGLDHGINPKFLRLKIPEAIHPYTFDKVLLPILENCVLMDTKCPSIKKKIVTKFIPYELFLEHKEEYEIMKEFSQKNIIRAIEAFEYPPENPRFYAIVMPRATTDLLTFLRYDISEALILKIMHQIFLAVQSIHKKNYIHRDLKFDNVLILTETADNVEVAICDFGLAIKMNERPMHGSGAGSLVYAAPEIVEYNGYRLEFKENAEYTELIDCWSLGVMLFGIFYNDLPFYVGPNENRKVLARECKKLFSYNVVFPEREISDEAKDLILHLLCPQEERLTIDEALNHPWFNLLQESPSDREREEAYQVIGDVEINAVDDDDDDIKQA